jgi:hypothetical protein
MVISCMVISCIVISCIVISCMVISCMVISCMVISCMVMISSVYISVVCFSVSGKTMEAVYFVCKKYGAFLDSFIGFTLMSSREFSCLCLRYVFCSYFYF